MIPKELRVSEYAYKKYKTRDIFKIIDARRLKIWHFEDPKNLLGFFRIVNRIQYVGINDAADEDECRSGLIHEISHSLNDYRIAASGTYFKDDFDCYRQSPSKPEYNANLTGADLFIEDDYILERISYGAYENLVAYIREKSDLYKNERTKTQFMEEQMREFYEIHYDIPSVNQLASELVFLPDVVTFKLIALNKKGYDLPNIPETDSCFLGKWQNSKKVRIS